MIEEFKSREQDAQFKLWMSNHPGGYYLNEGRLGNIRRRSGGTLLHRVGCHHLRAGEGVVSTTYAKVASEDITALRDWATQNGLWIHECSSCRPQ